MAGKRLIFAIPGCDEELGRDTKQALRSHGMTDLEYLEIVEGKSKILQCLERFDDVAVVIASQSQLNVPMEAADFDEFSTAGPSGDRIVVPILKNGEKGKKIMASLYSLGIYLALYQEDADIDNVAELVINGRSKAAVREYYGITAESVMDQAEEIRKGSGWRRNPKGAASSSAKTDAKGKKSSGKQKEKAPRLETGEYAVVGTNIGVGSTFQSVMLASAVKKAYKDMRVAVVELDNEENNMKVLCMQALDRMNVHGMNSFELGGVSYFFDTPMDAFMKHYRSQYDVVIYDTGFCDNATIGHLIKKVNRVFVVSDLNEWHRGELNEFVHEMNSIDLDRRLVYLFPCLTPQIMSDAITYLDGSRGYAVSFEASPFDPSRETISLLVSLMKEKLPSVKYPKSVTLEKRLKSGSAASGSGNLWKLTTLFFAVVALIAGLTGKQKYDTLYEQASASIIQANQNIETLNALVTEYEAENASMEKNVLRLKDDVVAGEEINWSMVESVTVKNDGEQDAFLTVEEMEEKVFCVSLPKDTVLYDYMLVEAIDEAPPITVTIGGAIDE